MSQETRRLIADRGHGLSDAQREALRWLATGQRDGQPPRRAVTWDALCRAGLVEPAWQWPGWQTTAEGQALADRMIRMPGGEQR